MGILTGGPFYDMIGRTGNNVGRKIRGKNVFSMRPGKSSKPATALQIAQRDKFRQVSFWVNGISRLVNIGFADYNAKMSPINAALSYNLKYAVGYDNGVQVLKYERLMYSRGQLAGPENVELNGLPEQKMKYTWKENTGDSNAKGTDKAIFVAYSPATGKFVVYEKAMMRSQLSFVVTLPGEFLVGDVHFYISFVSADGKLVSNSVYAGGHPIMR